MRKKYLLAALLILSVGFAAVSTTLYINGTSIINSNDKDFKVYYSDAKVNGTQDLSVVVDETHLSFTTTLDTLGETYVLDYDVTNGSKNYDAALTMNCTGGNDYLTVTNNFDTATNLAALQTRSGKLTLELTKSYTGDDLDVTIACTISANPVERNVLGEGTAANPVKPLATWIYTDSDDSGDISIGDVYTLSTNENESFNVISIDDVANTITMLASYNLGHDYRQTSSVSHLDYGVTFASAGGWEYTPGPKEIDIQEWSTNPKTYVNEYVSYLQEETGDTTISGNLITVTELGALGCKIEADYTVNDDYLDNPLTCAKSSNKKWLLNKQSWWTCSAYAGYHDSVYGVNSPGLMEAYGFGYTNYGVRPVITISKED